MKSLKTVVTIIVIWLGIVAEPGKCLEIYEACRDGDLNTVKRLVKEQVNLKVTTDGHGPFYIAKNRNDRELMKMLYRLDQGTVREPQSYDGLEEFINLKEWIDIGDTPLAIACEKGHIDIVNELVSIPYVQQKLDVDRPRVFMLNEWSWYCKYERQTQEAGWFRDFILANTVSNEAEKKIKIFDTVVTPLAIACLFGNVEIADLLVMKGKSRHDCRSFENFVVNPIYNGNQLYALIKDGDTKNVYPYDMSARDIFNQAFKDGRQKFFECLCKNGFKFEKIDLERAIRGDSRGCERSFLINLLLKQQGIIEHYLKGFDIDLWTTAMSVKNKRADVIGVLLNSGVQTAPYIISRYCLERAVYDGDVESSRILIEALGNKLEERDFRYACAYCTNEQILSIFFERGFAPKGSHLSLAKNNGGSEFYPADGKPHDGNVLNYSEVTKAINKRDMETKKADKERIIAFLKQHKNGCC